MTRHVAVLADGPSDPAAALRRRGYRVSEIGSGTDIASVLAELRPDVVFNAASSGRGGPIQGVLELLQLPYSHSGLLASALAANRHQAKIMFRASGIPVTDHVIVSRAEAARAHVMPPPYVIKPVIGGSGAGALIVRSGVFPPPEILREDWALGEEVMVERYIPGRDLSCAVMGDVALSVTERFSGEAEAGGEGRYAKAGSAHIIPAALQPKIYDKVQKLSLAAHAALGCRGVTRVDFRFNDAAGPDGEVVCLQIDTQPDMAETSLVPEQVVHAGHAYEELIAWMVEDASCNR